ncbi:hypothetical protein DV702_15345 [Sporosarcina sp. PTS2304]|uniref:hypothetical protein n=1 Tax=Sporosarcina sp. PTS2304 TaxID=2283194 RepID=UPI000E0DBE4A|nr:hypothetical protein [Sporosarcina sp. PTS2304]AXI00963.1 hypothetical protein DV702_15345 [Sporosarcina sp. PTS2304]
MKRRYITLLVIFILLIAAIYLWNEKNEESKTRNTIYLTQLSKDVEFLTTTVMLNSIPDTFELYSDEFTEEELSLFKNSLQIINRELSVASVNIEKIEDIDDRDNTLSESIDELRQLFSEIQEDAGKIDKDVFIKISEIAPDYSRKLNDLFYKPSAENIFKKGPDVLEEMNQEIEELIKQDK